MSEYYKIDYNQDGWPIVTMDGMDISKKKILSLLNSKTQKIELMKASIHELLENENTYRMSEHEAKHSELADVSDF